MRATDITTATVENELIRLSYGIRLLLASSNVKDGELAQATEQVEAVVDNLPLLAKLVMLDIGNPFIPGYENLLNLCNEVIVVTEPHPVTVQRTRQLLDDLGTKGFGRVKILTVVSINRVRADIQLSLIQMQEQLGTAITQVIPPAPEIAFQAATRNVPFIQVQIGSAVSVQYQNLAERLVQRITA
jgi:pilus assembly protein CpaE